MESPDIFTKINPILESIYIVKELYNIALLRLPAYGIRRLTELPYNVHGCYNLR